MCSAVRATAWAGPAARPRSLRGAPGDAQVPTGTTHIAPRASRFALQSPVALLALLALREREGRSPTPSPLLPRSAPAGPGTSAAILGPTGRLSPLQRQDPRVGCTHLLPVGANRPWEPLRGNSRAKWVPTGGLAQGFPPARATAPLIPPPPTELSPRGWTPTSQPGVRTRGGLGGHCRVPAPRPHPTEHHLPPRRAVPSRPAAPRRTGEEEEEGAE